MNNNNPVILVSKYFQTGKKNKELLSQPFADWGHPNPLMIFLCFIGLAIKQKAQTFPDLRFSISFFQMER